MRGDLCYRVVYHAHSSRQERPECVHVQFVHMLSSVGGCLQPDISTLFKAPEGPWLWLCHALGLSCLSPLWLGHIWGFFGQSSQLRALFWLWGEMLPISHVSSGITSPSQGSPQLLVAIVMHHTKRQLPPHTEVTISWIPVLLECPLSWLSMQWPYSWFLAGHALVFPALVVHSISR